MYRSLFSVGCLLFSTSEAIQKSPSVDPIQADGKASVANKRDKPLLFIGVNSAAEDDKDRQIIRNCWMKHNLLQGDNPKIVAKFMVAKPEDGTPEKEILDKDMAEHDDFIQVDAEEGYRKLTGKVIGFYQWAAEQQQAEYYMKIDDNKYPNLQQMYDHFSKDLQDGVKFAYTGDIVSGWMAVPMGKYAQDPSGWTPFSEYPDYAAGDGYVLQADLVKEVFGKPYEREGRWWLDNEDVNTGFWIDVANKNESSNVNVTYQDWKARIDYSCHPIGSDQARCCAADKSDKGQEWPNNPNGLNTA